MLVIIVARYGTIVLCVFCCGVPVWFKAADSTRRLHCTGPLLSLTHLYRRTGPVRRLHSPSSLLATPSPLPPLPLLLTSCVSTVWGFRLCQAFFFLFLHSGSATCTFRLQERAFAVPTLLCKMIFAHCITEKKNCHTAHLQPGYSKRFKCCNARFWSSNRKRKDVVLTQWKKPVLQQLQLSPNNGQVIHSNITHFFVKWWD